MLDIKNRFGDERRTSIDMTAIDYIEDESLIPEEDVIVTISNKNYIKRMITDNYKTQHLIHLRHKIEVVLELREWLLMKRTL